MNIKEFYQKLGTDHHDVCHRLVKEEIVIKYLKQFPDDNNFTLLGNALKEQNYEQAIHASHTLKGLCVTLDFANISKQVAALHHNLQQGNYTDNEQLFSEIELGYNQLVEWINLLG